MTEISEHSAKLAAMANAQSPIGSLNPTDFIDSELSVDSSVRSQRRDCTFMPESCASQSPT